MEPLAIRQAEEEDADAIAAVFTRSRRSVPSIPDLHSDEEDRDFIRDRVLVELDVLVAECSGAVVGFAAFGATRLEHLYVHPDHHGAGAGSLLLDAVKERLPDGFDLWTFEANTRAHFFYEGHGLDCIERTDGRGNEEKMPDRRYEWSGFRA